MPTVSFRGKQVTDRDVLRIPPLPRDARSRPVNVSDAPTRAAVAPVQSRDLGWLPVLGPGGSDGVNGRPRLEPSVPARLQARGSAAAPLAAPRWVDT